MTSTTRPSIDDVMMKVAEVMASRATCPAGHVGAVAAKNGQIIATAYNGVPSGFPHCDEKGCQRGPDGKHVFLIHAEENVIAQAAKYGISLAGATLYVTRLPCSHCAALMVQVGVNKVVYNVGPLGDTGEIAIGIFDFAKVELKEWYNTTVEVK